MWQPQLESKIQKPKLVVNLNVVCFNKFDDNYCKRIQEIHEELFMRQTNQVVVGYLSTIDNQNLSELEDTMQEMEFKRQSYPQIQQILVILHFIQINDNYNPVIMVERACNQFGGNPIMNISEEYCYSKLNLKNAQEQYKKATNSDLNGFDIFDKVEDEDLNKLYFQCLKEAETRNSNCILVYVNANNKQPNKNERFAKRILTIAEQFQ